MKLPNNDNEALLIQQFHGCNLNIESLVSSNSSFEKRAALVSSVNEVINSCPNKPKALFTIFIFVVAIFFLLTKGAAIAKPLQPEFISLLHT